MKSQIHSNLLRNLTKINTNNNYQRNSEENIIKSCIAWIELIRKKNYFYLLHSFECKGKQITTCVHNKRLLFLKKKISCLTHSLILRNIQFLPLICPEECVINLFKVLFKMKLTFIMSAILCLHIDIALVETRHSELF